MHGRVKVKTTAQQQAEKAKERAKKLLTYTTAIKLIFKKRAEKVYDEEGLKIAEEVLRSNPDFYSLWNFRRESFYAFFQQKSKSDMQELFVYELSFLEGCLQINPKSYGAWHHREWVLRHMPTPDWKKEVQLCNLFLEYDERNFHCWDFRRFVTTKAKVPAKHELVFTTEKINKNFSNYSSWHYRSKLLPLLYPDPEHPERPTEEILLQEYELAQNAFFTDPNDQSAWFYHRWLLGRGRKQQSLRLLHVNLAQKRLFVTFSQPASLQKIGTATVLVDDVAVEGRWHTPSGEDIHSLLWIFSFKEAVSPSLDSMVSVEVKPSECSILVLSACCNSGGASTVRSESEGEQASMWFTSQLSSEKTDILEKELESCRQLQELEEDNKWVILTVIFLMRALDPLKHAAETTQYFEALIAADPCRRNYFQDLQSKFSIENGILGNQGQDSAAMDLSSLKLSSLYHMDHLVAYREVNLGSNQLRSLKGCRMLQATEKLVADDNSMEDIRDLTYLPTLRELSLQKNNIDCMELLQPLKEMKLTKLNLEDNKVCDVEDFTRQIQQLIPSLLELNGQPLL